MLTIRSDLDAMSTMRALTRANNKARLFCGVHGPASYAETGNWGRLVVTVDGMVITVALLRDAPLFDGGADV